MKNIKFAAFVSEPWKYSNKTPSSFVKKIWFCLHYITQKVSVVSLADFGKNMWRKPNYISTWLLSRIKFQRFFYLGGFDVLFIKRKKASMSTLRKIPSKWIGFVYCENCLEYWVNLTFFLQMMVKPKKIAEIAC